MLTPKYPLPVRVILSAIVPSTIVSKPRRPFSVPSVTSVMFAITCAIVVACPASLSLINRTIPTWSLSAGEALSFVKSKCAAPASAFELNKLIVG